MSRDALIASATTIRELSAIEDQLEHLLASTQKELDTKVEDIQRRLHKGESTGNEYLDNVLEIWQTDDSELVAAWQHFRETLKRYEGQMFIIARHTGDGESATWSFRCGLIKTEREMTHPIHHTWIQRKLLWGRESRPITIALLPCSPDIDAEESPRSNLVSGGYNAGCIEIGREELRLFLLHQKDWVIRFHMTAPGADQPRKVQTLWMLIGNKAVNSFPLWKQEEKFAKWLHSTKDSLARVRSVLRRNKRKNSPRKSGQQLRNPQ